MHYVLQNSLHAGSASRIAILSCRAFTAISSVTGDQFPGFYRHNGCGVLQSAIRGARSGNAKHASLPLHLRWTDTRPAPWRTSEQLSPESSTARHSVPFLLFAVSDNPKSLRLRPAASVTQLRVQSCFLIASHLPVPPCFEYLGYLLATSKAARLFDKGDNILFRTVLDDEIAQLITCYQMPSARRHPQLSDSSHCNHNAPRGMSLLSRDLNYLQAGVTPFPAKRCISNTPLSRFSSSMQPPFHHYRYYRCFATYLNSSRRLLCQVAFP